MKRCPTCQSVYTDNSLIYCLQDGSKLSDVQDSGASDDVAWRMSTGGRDLPATEVLKQEDMPTVRMEPGVTTQEQRARPTALNQPVRPSAGVHSVPPLEAPRSNKTVIALSIVVVVLLLALGGLLTWVMLRDKTGGSGQQANTGTNANTGTSQRAAPANAEALKKEVESALTAWADTIRQRNLDAHMEYYTEVLEVYYNSTNVSRAQVREDRAAAFSKYNSLDMRLSNLNISIDPSGDRAIANFDKTFDFRGSDKNFSGSGLNRFWLKKIDGRWRIAGERELKTYYVNK